jgi:hypothetical protein
VEEAELTTVKLGLVVVLAVVEVQMEVLAVQLPHQVKETMEVLLQLLQ